MGATIIARVVGILVFFAAAGCVSTTLSGVAFAEDTTPTQQPTATVAPDSSEITIKFMAQGIASKVHARAELGFISADGYACVIPVTGFFELVDQISFVWPLPVEAGQPAECSKAAPTQLVVYILTSVRDLRVPLTWVGTDITYEVELNESPQPTATETPVSLPPTGGPPTRESSAVFIVLACLYVAILAAGWGMALRMR